MTRVTIWPWLILAALLTAWSCASFEHPQSNDVAKAELAAKLAVCVDNAATDYAAQTQPKPLDPSPYEDSGVALVTTDAGRGE
jgi:hypothetical protein